MNKKYSVKILSLNKQPELIITETKFQELKEAKECLSNIFSFEEKYELLLANYMELEKECLNIAVKYMIKNNFEYQDFFDIKLLLNQRIVNLLTAARLYLDQIQQHIRICNLNFDVKSLFSFEYDNNFEYRFMEALRNYVQHRGLAVHSTSIKSNWTSLKDDGELQFRILMFTNKDNIGKDRVFKKQVLEEMPEKVNLLYTSRVYIESISKVHCKIREKLNKNVTKSRQIIEEIISEYKKINNGKSNGLCAIYSINYDGHEEILDKFYLTLEWDNIRIKLAKKNRSLINLKKRYVSNSIK